jgi:hypothetical protein
MVFDETVMISTMVLSRFEFIGADHTNVVSETGTTARHYLTPSSFSVSNFVGCPTCASPTDGTEIYFELTESDLDELKRKDVCFREDDCFVRLDADAIRDMAGNKIANVGDNEKVHVSHYNADITRPFLESF